MNPVLQFLQKFSYTNPNTASFQALNNYLSQLEKLASSQKDPTASRIIKTLRSTPINKIGYQLTQLERYLIVESAKQEKKANDKKANPKQPKAKQPKPSSSEIKIYKS